MLTLFLIYDSHLNYKRAYGSISGAKDEYAKDGRPGEAWLLCSFYHESLRTWIKTNVSKFVISSHMAFKSHK